MTHPTGRVRRHGRRSRPARSGARTPSGRPPGIAATALRLLLVGLFTAGLAVFVPGAGQAAEDPAGERVFGTLQTSVSGPIEGVTVEVAEASGAEIETVETDEQGRWSVDLPGPGQYTVTVDAEDLPEGITLNGEPSRTVTVDQGRQQGVLIGLNDGSRNAGGGTIRWVELLVSGLRFGLLIAMAAIGLSLIFGTTGLVNFSHGELVTVGAIVAWYINVQGDIPLIPAALMAMVVGAGIGALSEVGLWRPLRRRGTGLVAALVISIGLSLLLRYLYQIVYGGRSNAFADYRGQRTVDYGAFSMTNKDLTSMIVALVVLVLVALMLQRTTIGKAMRAVSDNRDLAASSGIDVNRVILVVWMVGGALAALGGVLLGLSDEVQWDMGFRLLLLMFAGVTLGGLGTAYGALVGSIVVGVFVQMSTLVIPNDMKYVGGLLLLIVILIVRPQGILGSRARIG